MDLFSDLLPEIVSSLSEHGYELGPYLGSGCFGAVHLVKTPRYGDCFAVKLLLAASGHKYHPVAFESAFAPLTRLNHPSLVRLHQVWSSENVHYLLTDYMSHGTIPRLVREEHGLDDTMMRRVGAQILSAFAFCHSHNIYHGDVKPANIFLDELQRARVGDFGFSSTLLRLKEETAVRGSIAFLAPERLLGRPTTPAACDVWSLGVTFFFLATDSLPWKLSSIEAAIEQIKEAWVVYPETMNPELCDVLSAMLNEAPDERPSMKQVLDMPFFKQPSEIQPVPTLLTPMPFPTARTLVVPKAPRPLIALPSPVGKPVPKRQIGSIGGMEPPPLDRKRVPRPSVDF
jgi:serine/threonine protein kinase